MWGHDQPSYWISTKWERWVTFLSLLFIWNLFTMHSQSCGYSVPLYEFNAHRTGLNNLSVKLETEDIKAEIESCPISTSPSLNTSAVTTTSAVETDNSSEVQTYPSTAKGLKGYWRDKNYKSIDGLPGVTSGFKASQPFSPNAKKAKAAPRHHDVEPTSSNQIRSLKVALSELVPGWEQEKHGIVVGFILGAMAMIVAERGISRLAGIQWSW